MLCSELCSDYLLCCQSSRVPRALQCITLVEVRFLPPFCLSLSRTHSMSHPSAFSSNQILTFSARLNYKESLQVN